MPYPNRRAPASSSPSSNSHLTFIPDDAAPRSNMPQIAGVSRPRPSSYTFQLAYQDANRSWTRGTHSGWRTGRLLPEAQPVTPDTHPHAPIEGPRNPIEAPGPRNPFVRRSPMTQEKAPSLVSSGQRSQAGQGMVEKWLNLGKGQETGGADEKPQALAKDRGPGATATQPMDIRKPDWRDELTKQSERNFEQRLRSLSAKDARIGEDVSDKRTREWVERAQSHERQQSEDERSLLSRPRAKTAAADPYRGWSGPTFMPDDDGRSSF